MASSARIEELKKKFDENPRRYFAPLANEFRKTGDFDQAILICQEFLPQQPGHMSGHIVFGQALFEAGRLDEARAVFETALTLDPENLIALRHLGDISKAGGDVEGARAWYRRVLDADPRNEEIASVLASLDEPATVAWTSPTPRSVSSVSGEPEQMDAQPSDARAPQNPLEAAPPERPLIDFEAMMNSAAPRSDAPPEHAPVAPRHEADLIDLEDTELTFSGMNPPPVEGLEVERSVETPAGFESMVMDAASQADASSFPAMEGLESTTFTPPSPPAAAPVPAENGEPPSAQPKVPGRDEPFVPFEHIEQPASAERAEPVPVKAAVPERPPVPEAASAPREPEKPVEAAHAGASGFVTETMAELYVQQGHVEEAILVYQQLVQRYPGDEVLRARLAELETTRAQSQSAEAQGPELLETRPGEAPGVLQRIADERALSEASAAAPSPEPSQAAEPTAAPAPAAEAVAEARISEEPAIEDARMLASDTPTIREFLGAIASRLPAAPAALETPGEDVAPSWTENGAAVVTTAERVTDDIVFSELETLGTSAAPQPRTEESIEAADSPTSASEEDAEAAYTSAADGTESAVVADAAESDREGLAEPARNEPSIGGSIDALFTGAETSTADEEAASTLAGAFSPDEPGDQQPMAGNPARRAQDELSLDHVFRERASVAERGPSPFSFDQFFSQNASERANAAASDQAGAPAASPDDDIQQFNAWLEGLKKT